MMNDCILSGFAELPDSDQQVVVDFCRDRSHWAALRKPKKKKAAAETTDAACRGVSAADGGTAAADSSSTISGMSVVPLNGNLVAARQKFQIPQPGVSGASVATVFSGKRFVLTGIFPEIGGGAGITLGKERTKKMIEAFGGRVTSSISGKTDVLVVGKDPGFSKVSQARERGSCHFGSLKELKDGLDAGAKGIEEFSFYNREEPLKIQNFSSGYLRGGIGNGKFLEATKDEKATAQGFTRPTTQDSSPRPTAAKKGPPPDEAPASNDEKKPAAKPSSCEKRRKPSSSNVPDGSESTNTAPKKRKTVPRASKENTQETTSLAVADTTSKTQNVISKPSDKQATIPARDSDDEMEEVITCDVCKVECTEESWFWANKETDFCPDCHAKERIKDAVLQRRGMTVALE